MLSRCISALAVACALAILPSAAHAAQGPAVGDETGVAVATPQPYPPRPPGGPSLAGSVASGVCVDDVPAIAYSVTMSDPDSQVTETAAVLVMTDGANTVEVPLGDLADGSLSGSVLWPGSSVDADGNATGWPGWALRNGEWTETSGNYGWTRGAISALIRVNPEVAVPLSYPGATPGCVAGPRSAGEPASAGVLAITGMAASYAPLGIGAGALIAVGAGLIIARRRAAARR